MIHPQPERLKQSVPVLKKRKNNFVNVDIPPFYYKALPNCQHINIAYKIWKDHGMGDKDPRENFREIKSQYHQALQRDSNK